MDNQKFQIESDVYILQNNTEALSNATLDFKIQESNEVEPYFPIKTLEIIFDGDTNSEAYFSFDIDQFDSLIDYLERLNRYCKQYNKEQKEIALKKEEENK